MLTDFEGSELVREDSAATIRLLQEELAETNREVMTLTLELDKRVEELQSAEQRYRRLAENAPDIIFRYELSQRWLSFVNPQLASVTGYTPQDCLEEADFLFQIVHPDDRPILEAVFAGESPGIGTITVRWLHKTGAVIWIEQRHSFVHDVVGRPVAIECIARDITDRKDLEEQLRQAQKMEAVGRLAGGIAHDFNNLLTVILGYASMLQRPVKNEDTFGNMALKIQQAAEKAALLTGQLLSFSRKQTVQMRVLDLNRFIGEMTDMLRQLAGEDIALQFNPVASAVSIVADSGQLSQILMNLVANARDAMPLGGSLRIDTASAVLEKDERGPNGLNPVGPYAKMTISDSGSGMDASTKAHIFEPFFTTKEVGKGTGLGLATVHGIVQQHGGWIEVDSEPHRGTSFVIYFPQSISEPSETEAATQKVAPARTATILLVEDQAPVRTLAEEVLTEAGYRVLCASDGRTALELFEGNQESIDLLITDVVMPGLSGPELASHLTGTAEDLMVLYMSGYTDHALLHSGMMGPGTALLHKPFLPETLVCKVDELLSCDKMSRRTSLSG
jgi:two-component system cell cycle sensor histidine kinase/response regulator CckA